MQTAALSSGVARHSEAELLELALEIYDDLAELLGDKDTFFDTATPSTLDCVVFGFLGVQLCDTGLDYALRRRLFADEKYRSLRRFTKRCKERFFADVALEMRELDQSLQ